MSAVVEGSPQPLGGPQVDADPRASWAAEKAQLGGFPKPVSFSEEQIAALNAAADELIPPGDGFPAPSSVGIVEFVGRYVTPEGAAVKFYPLAAERDFKQHLDALGQDFARADSATKLDILRRLEREEPAFFEQLRGLVYYGYYSRPQVVQAIRENLPAGRDYHGPPQPYGYLAVIEPWDATMFAFGRGRYTATEDVKPVDVPADLR